MTRKLTRSLADSMRADHAGGMTVSACARKYVVCWTHAKRVIAGEAWVGRPLRRREMRDHVIAEVRKSLEGGACVSSLADAHGYHYTLISKIKNRRGRFAA